MFSVSSSRIRFDSGVSAFLCASIELSDFRSILRLQRQFEGYLLSSFP